MENLLKYDDFSVAASNDPNAKCVDCKRMYCQLRNVNNNIICNDCYDIRFEKNPELFLKSQPQVQKEQPIQVQPVQQQVLTQPIVQNPEPVMQAQNKNVEAKQDISIGMLLLYIFIGVGLLTGISLAIFFGLQSGQLI